MTLLLLTDIPGEVNLLVMGIIPEPSTLVMLTFGSVGLGLRRRRGLRRRS